MRFGNVNTGCPGARILTGAVSSVTRGLPSSATPDTAAGSRVDVVALLILHDQRAAALHVLQQPAVVGDEVGPRLRGADADDDGVEARQVAGRQHVGVEQRDVDAHAAHRVGHLIAAAHDVADLHRRDLEVQHLRRAPCRRVEPMRLDVRIRDQLHVAARTSPLPTRASASMSNAARPCVRRRRDGERRRRLVARGLQA